MNFIYQNKRISYSDNGEGQAIVLLHGYLESGLIWNGFADKLAKHFRVINIDLPGAGLSDTYGEVHTMEFMASAVKALVENAGLGNVFLAGHSLGGYVTMAFVDLFPGLLSGYCLFHSTPFADTPEATDKRLREIEIVRSGKKNLIYPDNVTRMFADSNLEKFSSALGRSKDIASQIPGEGIIAVLNGMMQRPSRLAIMEEGRVPCLWILGAHDNYIPCEVIQTRVNLPSNARKVILNKSGHMGFIEEEEESVRAVMEFISNLP